MSHLTERDQSSSGTLIDHRSVVTSIDLGYA